MYNSQRPYRELFQKLIDLGPDKSLEEALDLWLSNNHQEIEWIKGLASKDLDTWRTIDVEQLCKLYALQRIDELLSLGFQKDNIPSYKEAKVSSSFYASFFSRLGLQALSKPYFHPFFHEIHEIVESGNTEIEILEELNPTLMIGPLLFSRGLVNLAAPKGYFKKSLAEQSRLYWSCYKRNRPCEDLSHG